MSSVAVADSKQNRTEQSRLFPVQTNRTDSAESKSADNHEARVQQVFVGHALLLDSFPS